MASNRKVQQKLRACSGCLSRWPASFSSYATLATHKISRVFAESPWQQRQLCQQQHGIPVSTTQAIVKACPGSVLQMDELLNSTSGVAALAFLLKRCSQTRALSEAYSKNGFYKEALDCFERMRVSDIKADNVTFVCALDACANRGCLEKGRQIHVAVSDGGYEGHASVGISLVNMYGKCGSVEDARSVFSRLPHQDVVSWSAMIAACAQNGHGKEALDLFHKMQLSGIKPDEIAFLCVLDACATLASLEKGQEIHAAIIDSGFEGKLAVGTALINMYGKCRSVDKARSMFARMASRNLISWNSMITACSQNGHGKEALYLFNRMQLEGFKPDQITFVCALDACASLSAIEKGRETHAAILHGGYDRHVVVGNALINMYGKCGSVEDAMNVFIHMSHLDVVSWNAMISACAHNGHGKKALHLFNQMKSTRCKPDHVTFLSILSACSHTGQVDDARHYFDLMHKDQGLMQRVEHYVCLVDILCRAGHLDDAEDVINRMPFQNESKVWMCLLRACKVHGDVERGVRAASHVFKWDPENAAPYLLLSDIYAAARKWDEAENMAF
ncbi:hypothetical protein O6H91_11G066900 [Diphasiastrum complanatum]|uniref:Uncharacterized protein n=2 Tax=Diphasiastrum complanatum TaxID=34168 RepID=A0ACC2CA31_DIPCM|nr:hypothetical protein O6H91_11G066900 [Diphasiastrum complanatum]KAJ7538873.1 hypothetical protein O6H91_11G066900 [Diphasiastrum complanatum]